MYSMILEWHELTEAEQWYTWTWNGLNPEDVSWNKWTYKIKDSDWNSESMNFN